jgi:glycerol-3-phosphate acyltransferase PlsX
MRIAIDAMGGDRAPAEIVAGACAAARDFGVEVILVGDEAAIQSCFGSSNKALGKTSIEIPAMLPKGVTIHHASQVVDMEEAPMQAMRKKPGSSVAVATQLHADGKADAVLSAGNTGAAATLALFKLKRIAGIDRPGIASVFPTSKNPTVVLDVGANVDCKPRHLAEFAVMGAAYARNVEEIIPGVGSWIPKGKLPGVGLLSIGEEQSKGNDLTKSAFKLLQDNAAEGKYQFFGNVEGRDIGKGTVDVVVCDGFVGNVVLKVSEGLAKMLTGELKSALTSSPRSRLGALLLKPALMRMRKRLDYTGYGGALLLGVNGVCVICHGSADARSIHSAIRIAKQTVSADVVGAIRSIMEDSSGAIAAQQKALDEASANASASALVNGANAQNTLHQNGSGGEKLSDGIVPPISF